MNFCRGDDCFIRPERVLPGHPCRHRGEAPRAAASFNRWIGDEGAEGSGAFWQMVCNLTKSRLGGVGRSSMLEGEPRSQESAWNTYARWILEGTQNAVARPKLRGGRYVIAWAVRFDPCVAMEPGRYYSPGNGTVLVGLNIAVGDPDRPTDGIGNYGGFRPEQW